jgi:chemotaxis protein histidine kinase CheA
MNTARIGVRRRMGWISPKQGIGRPGLLQAPRGWQQKDVGAVIDAAGLSEEGRPGPAAKEMRRKLLELSRENAKLAAENQEQSEEISGLIDVAAKAQDELVNLAGSVAVASLRRIELQPFWALATPEARLLLVTAHLNGPVHLAETIQQAENSTEVLEAICRLRTVGFIKFESNAICITATGEGFARRLGFIK